MVWLALVLLCFRIEVDFSDSAPIAGRTGPTVWVGVASCAIHLGAVIQEGLIDLHVTLGRRYKANRAVPMLVVVPVHQLRYPAPRLQQAINGRTGICGRYFSVLNSASENGLSLLTAGRLRDAATPRRCMVASIVSPFIGEPLSE